MTNIWEKSISILAGNLNLGCSYLIKTVFSPLCSGRLARIATTANGMAVAEHYAPFVRRFLPVLSDLSLTVKLEQQDHENNCVLRKCNCCSNNNHSRNLESYPQFRSQFCRSHNLLGNRKTRNMLEPPQILLHSTSLDIQEEGKTIFVHTWYFFIWDQKYVHMGVFLNDR